jgi:DNA-binding transcriptional LysR family regulator
VLLHEASVTKTAEGLQVTQPAVSLSLARLRRHFGDDLLRRSGNRYKLTPLAVELKGPDPSPSPTCPGWTAC